mmetsp:Transcript_1708/g.4967  ORF Transcript_1708/g.4967 Transcript_1708/m.4967 type:complete len:274 (-) Transcript_1708:1727-2548(-)
MLPQPPAADGAQGGPRLSARPGGRLRRLLALQDVVPQVPDVVAAVHGLVYGELAVEAVGQHPAQVHDGPVLPQHACRPVARKGTRICGGEWSRRGGLPELGGRRGLHRHLPVQPRRRCGGSPALQAGHEGGCEAHAAAGSSARQEEYHRHLPWGQGGVQGLQHVQVRRLGGALPAERHPLRRDLEPLLRQPGKHLARGADAIGQVTSGAGGLPEGDQGRLLLQLRLLRLVGDGISGRQLPATLGLAALKPAALLPAMLTALHVQSRRRPGRQE